ncbi:MAG: hypothetical protein CVU06_12955, partial [Bacteroidetes bacterium HGW-Bacteroidetes-22]
HSNPEQPAIQGEVPKEIKEPFRTIMLTHDDQWVVAGTTDGHLVIWSLQTFPKGAIVVKAHASIVSSLTADPAGALFYSAGSDGRLVQWKYQGNKFTPTVLDSIADAIRCTAINRAADQLVYATNTGVVKIITFNQGQPGSKVLTRLKSPVLTVKYDDRGETIAAGCLDGSVQLMRQAKNGEVHVQSLIGRHISGVTAVAFNPAGNALTSAGYDWTAKISDYPLTEEKPVTIKNHDLWIYDVLYTPDGKQLITCSADRTIRIFSTLTQQMAEKLTPMIKRNMTVAEWNKMVGEDVPYQKTIENLP